MKWRALVEEEVMLHRREPRHQSLLVEQQTHELLRGPVACGLQLRSECPLVRAEWYGALRHGGLGGME